MSLVDKLETNVTQWYKNVPHLPVNAQKWLAENVWWLAIISVVASVIGIFVLIGAILTYSTVMSVVAQYYVGQPVYGPGWIFVSLSSLAFTIGTAVLTAMAISPLRTRRKKGWDLLFLTLLVSAVSVVVGAVLTLNIASFVGNVFFGAVVVAISAYFLFEIRSYFVSSTERPKTPEYKPPVNQ